MKSCPVNAIAGRPVSSLVGVAAKRGSKRGGELPPSVDRMRWTLGVISRYPMKKTRFTESQIVGVLNEAEAGVSVAELMRRHGISKQTYLRWKSKYA